VNADVLIDYIHNTFGHEEDDVLASIRSAIPDQGLPLIHVQPYEGLLLNILLLMTGAKKVIEIGTLAGYSTTWLARALPEDGKLYALERDEHHADITQENINKAGVGDRVEVMVGDARDNLKTLVPHAPFDAVFIDADKPGYPAYARWAIDYVRTGGVVMAHNALYRERIFDPSQHDEPGTKAIMETNELLAADARIRATIISLDDDGLLLGVKISD